MKRVFFVVGWAAAFILWVAAPKIGFAQNAAPAPSIQIRYKTIPLHAVSAASKTSRGAAAAAVAAQGLPTWNYSITSPMDGNLYTGTIVGASPYFNGARTTNIPTFIVPLIVVMPDGGIFDPTASDSCAGSLTPIAQVQGSPIFNATQFTMNGINMGNDQYVDAFQRANFWSTNVVTTGESYHTVLSPVTTLPAVTIQIPSGMGSTNSLGCPRLGIVDFNTINSILTNTVLPQLASAGVAPNSFPLFVVHDVVMGDPGDSLYENCCLAGFHGAVGSPAQTYALADYDTTGVFHYIPNISPVSAVVGNWMDDPMGTNLAPSWGNLGEIDGCYTNFEAAGPLQGYTFDVAGITMPNGMSYYPQELAFYSWFFRQNPSIGADGVASDDSTLFHGQPILCD